MSIEKAKAALAARGIDPARVREFDVSSATVALAAQALGCEEARIAKSAAGDVKVDNAKYKARFQAKARMLGRDEAADCVGHAVGGVCPFGVKEGVEVYLDESLRRFETVFPAAGSANSAVELSIPELETASAALGWVDVCREA